MSGFSPITCRLGRFFNLFPSQLNQWTTGRRKLIDRLSQVIKPRGRRKPRAGRSTRMGSTRRYDDPSREQQQLMRRGLLQGIRAELGKTGDSARDEEGGKGSNQIACPSGRSNAPGRSRTRYRSHRRPTRSESSFNHEYSFSCSWCYRLVRPCSSRAWYGGTPSTPCPTFAVP